MLGWCYSCVANCCLLLGLLVVVDSVVELIQTLGSSEMLYSEAQSLLAVPDQEIPQYKAYSELLVQARFLGLASEDCSCSRLSSKCKR